MVATEDYVLEGCTEGYTDTDEDEWYHDYICETKKYELFDLINGQFRPGASVTRGEYALTLYRLHLAGVL